ncbi:MULTISPECIES: serine/threonine-protein kinase [unclassified Streptomyces]|uniref:serine/threonine-protein kinase n=1 Tax=unclassified Streptomyces TaxID=2593676 RepID=UPI002E82329B|nr:serine/threonine-protein kinase [Streptomyces sp. NBC_00523]WUD03130.1 serine/threonine protein kinase [Streptomyces sp. NBC_00523]
MNNDDHADHEDYLDGGIKPLTPTDPARVGPYLLLGRLGAGGMGRVYLARSDGGRTVAVKVVHAEHVADPQFRGRFRREVEAARRVGERWTAPVLDAAPDAEFPWVATGYVPGLSLEQVVRGHGALPAASVQALATGLLHALKDIHAAGIVHRDLKPSNVMLTMEGPKVIDFGIARAIGTAVESLLTSTNMMIGTPGFMAPEQVQGESAVPKSDVFTLGCVLTYAATGTLPFGHGASNQHAIMYRIAEAEPELERVRDADLKALIARLLVKPIEERPSVDELLAEPGREAGPVASSWLPAAVVSHLARQSAQLLDAEAEPLRQEGDRPTVDLRSAPEVAAAVVEGPKTAEKEKPKRRRPWLVTVPLVVVLGGGGGTLVMLQPFSHEGGDAHAAPPAVTSTGPTADPGPSVAGSASPTGSKSPKAAPSKRKKADTGKDGKDGKDGQPGKDGRNTGSSGSTGSGSSSGGSSSTGGGGSSSTTTSGGSSGGSSTGGSSTSTSGGGGSTSTSGGSSTGGSGGGGSAVPASFVGTWKFGEVYNTNQPGTIKITKSGVVTLTDYVYASCPYEAKVTSSSSGRINISASKLVGPNPGYCYNETAPSSFVTSGSGIQHDVSGFQYYYKRA